MKLLDFSMGSVVWLLHILIFYHSCKGLYTPGANSSPSNKTRGWKMRTNATTPSSLNNSYSQPFINASAHFQPSDPHTGSRRSSGPEQLGTFENETALESLERRKIPTSGSNFMDQNETVEDSLEGQKIPTSGANFIDQNETVEDSLERPKLMAPTTEGWYPDVIVNNTGSGVGHSSDTRTPLLHRIIEEFASRTLTSSKPNSNSFVVSDRESTDRQSGTMQRRLRRLRRIAIKTSPTITQGKSVSTGQLLKKRSGERLISVNGFLETLKVVETVDRIARQAVTLTPTRNTTHLANDNLAHEEDNRPSSNLAYKLYVAFIVIATLIVFCGAVLKCRRMAIHNEHERHRREAELIQPPVITSPEQRRPSSPTDRRMTFLSLPGAAPGQTKISLTSISPFVVSPGGPNRRVSYPTSLQLTQTTEGHERKITPVTFFPFVPGEARQDTMRKMSTAVDMHALESFHHASRKQSSAIDGIHSEHNPKLYAAEEEESNESGTSGVSEDGPQQSTEEEDS